MSIGAVAGLCCRASLGQCGNLVRLAGLAAGSGVGARVRRSSRLRSHRPNQVASGLALSILGVGLSAFIGKPYESLTLPPVPALPLPLLSDIPVLGPAFFDQQALVCASWVLFGAIGWFLYRSRAGPRAAGDRRIRPHPRLRSGCPSSGFATPRRSSAARWRGWAARSFRSTTRRCRSRNGGRARLDRARAGRVRDVAAGARSPWRLPFRRRDDRAAFRPGSGVAGRGSFAVPVGASVSWRRLSCSC